MLLCEYIHVYILCVSIYMTIVTLLLRNLDYLDDEQFSLWRQLTDSSQTSFPSQYVHRSVCSAANHADCLELPAGCLAAAKQMQNEHFLYGTCRHNCSV